MHIAYVWTCYQLPTLLIAEIRNSITSHPTYVYIGTHPFVHAAVEVVVVDIVLPLLRALVLGCGSDSFSIGKGVLSKVSWFGGQASIQSDVVVRDHPT